MSSMQTKQSAFNSIRWGTDQLKKINDNKCPHCSGTLIVHSTMMANAGGGHYHIPLVTDLCQLLLGEWARDFFSFKAQSSQNLSEDIDEWARFGMLWIMALFGGLALIWKGRLLWGTLIVIWSAVRIRGMKKSDHEMRKNDTNPLMEHHFWNLFLDRTAQCLTCLKISLLPENLWRPNMCDCCLCMNPESWRPMIDGIVGGNEKGND